MPTLSLEGLVYLADELDRRQLIRLAPSLAVEQLISHSRCLLAESGDAVTVSDIEELPNAVARVFFCYISSGEATVLLENDEESITFEKSKMILLMDVTSLSSVTITATADNTVYDLFVGGYTVDEGG
jgi:hypothetical protein